LATAVACSAAWAMHLRLPLLQISLLATFSCSMACPETHWFQSLHPGRVQLVSSPWRGHASALLVPSPEGSPASALLLPSPEGHPALALLQPSPRGSRASALLLPSPEGNPASARRDCNALDRMSPVPRPNPTRRLAKTGECGTTVAVELAPPLLGDEGTYSSSEGLHLLLHLALSATCG